MNKRFLSCILAGALLTSSAMSFWSCKDYSEDIQNLQEQIDAVKVSLEDIKALINSGSVVTDVKSSDKGIELTMSNGNTYLIEHGQDGVNGTDGKDGKDGKDGVDGKNAVVWSIGPDGYWYQDGQKTDFKAIGTDGKDGVNGTDGKDGANGKDGADGKDGVNGKDGADGKDGVNGKDGADGKDGDTWSIGPDGYWYINGTKTDYKAIGTDGKDGVDGTNGKDGVDGADGKDGSQITIGADGFWYIDGVKTEYPATGPKGEDGKDGADGKDGVDGTNGKDGVNGKDATIYYPNPETGYWAIVAGNDTTDTEISWLAAGMTAVKEGNLLAFYDGTGALIEKIELGARIGSLEFVAGTMSSALPGVATTDKQFVLVNTWDDKPTSTVEGKEDYNLPLAKQETWPASDVAMLYRINPSDAYTVDHKVSFINSTVGVRNAVAGNTSDLLIIADTLIENGQIKLNVRINCAAYKPGNKHVASLEIKPNNDAYSVVSDMIYVDFGESLYARLYNANNGRMLTRRTKSTQQIDGKTVTSTAFINSNGGKSSSNIVNLNYNDGSVDLSKVIYVGYAKEKLVDLGFADRVSYQFSKPEEYLVDEENVQELISVSEAGVVAINKDKAPTIASAYMKNAYVLCNAYVDEKLVATAYVRIVIGSEDLEAGGGIAFTEVVEGSAYSYKSLAGSQKIATISKEQLTAFYKTLGFKDAATFFAAGDNGYDANNITYTLKAKHNIWNAKNKAFELGDTTLVDNVVLSGLYNAQGVEVLATQDTMQVAINNAIKTDSTFNGNKNGALYTVEITLNPNNKEVNPALTFTYNFTIAADGAFALNDAVLINNVIRVIGDVKDGSLKMRGSIANMFKKGGYDSFDKQNISAVNFAWAKDEKGVEIAGDYAQLNSAIKADLQATMTYTKVLDNGEEHTFDYEILFVNPFKQGVVETIALNLPSFGGKVEADASKQVNVIDRDNQDIIKALKLSDVAKNTYKLGNPIYKYEFVQDDQYKKFMEEAGKSMSTTDGAIVIETLGNELAYGYEFKIKATVTWTGIAEVECIIPVTLNK
ncbi:MAG: hypothetical protein IJ280_04495 [Bacteroidales bacterium]|nr:hypothetical protein [Bacteroidales bacterium]